MKMVQAPLAVLGLLLATGIAAAQAPEVTAEHKVLAGDAGTWKAKMTMYIPGTDQTIEGEGTEVNTLFANGLWLSSKFEGTFAGQPFEGQGHNGYDPNSKKYVGSWVDSMSTSVSTMVGEYDDNTMTGMMTSKEPTTGEEVVTKSVTVNKDKNTRIMTMYNKSPETGDEWIKTMVIEYTRVK